MVDTRFHRFSGPLTLGTLLVQIGRADLAESVSRPDHVVSGVAELDLAAAGDLALAAHPSYIEELRRTAAGAVLVAPALLGAVPAHAIAIPVERPHNVFAD